MAQKSTKTILSSSSPGPGPLLPKETLPATNTPAPHRRNWKQYIRHRISKPSVEVFIALAMVTGLYCFPTALSNLGVSNEFTNGTPAIAEDCVVLSGEIPKFDWQSAELVSVQWSLYGMGRYKLQLPDVPPGSNIPPGVAMDIYIDTAPQPVFSYDPAEVLPLTDLGVEGLTSDPSVYTFRTERETLSCKHQYYAPHDCYSISTSGFAIEKETNNSIPLFLRLDDSEAGDFDAVSTLSQRAKTFTRIVDGQLATTEVDSSKLFSNITRSKRARTFIYSLFTINWLLTLCSMIITALSLWRGEKLKYNGVLVQITLFLAIPAVRALYPAAPPLGVFIDLVGYFPQLLSVAFCTAVTLVSFATRHDNKGVSRLMGPLSP